MNIKKLILLIATLIIVFSFSLTAYAMPMEDDNEDDFLKVFGIDEEELINEGRNLYSIDDKLELTKEKVESKIIEPQIIEPQIIEPEIDEEMDTKNEVNIFSKILKKDVIQETIIDNEQDVINDVKKDIKKEVKKDINDFGIFYLNKGFSSSSIITFANTKNLSGKGEEATIVGVYVYNIITDEDQKKNIISPYESIKTIGASGIYNEAIDLSIGQNYIIIAIKKDDFIKYKNYEIIVKEEETKELLENIQVNFIKSDEDNNIENQENNCNELIQNIINTFSIEDK